MDREGSAGDLEPGDQVCLMEEGRVVLKGTPDEVLVSGREVFIAGFSCGRHRG